MLSLLPYWVFSTEEEYEKPKKTLLLISTLSGSWFSYLQNSDQLQQLFVVAVSPTGTGHTKTTVAKIFQEFFPLFLIYYCIWYHALILNRLFPL